MGLSLLEQLEILDSTADAEEQPRAKPKRPRGAPPCNYGEAEGRLTARHRRIALLAAAGMSNPAIAIQLETSAQVVDAVLKRPQVAQFLVKLTAQTATEIAPVARRISEELEVVAGEAFDRQVGVMRRLDDVGDEALDRGDLKNGIRAKLGVVSTTQDILDRAGKRAPTRTIGAMVHAFAPQQLEALERIIGEATAVGTPSLDPKETESLPDSIEKG